MDKSQKLRALLQVAQGKPLNQVFMKIDVFLIKSETTTEITYFPGEGKILEKTFLNTDVEDFISKLKKAHPYKVITVTRWTKEEYEYYTAKFEREY